MQKKPMSTLMDEAAERNGSCNAEDLCGNRLRCLGSISHVEKTDGRANLEAWTEQCQAILGPERVTCKRGRDAWGPVA